MLVSALKQSRTYRVCWHRQRQRTRSDCLRPEVPCTDSFVGASGVVDHDGIDGRRRRDRRVDDARGRRPNRIRTRGRRGGRCRNGYTTSGITRAGGFAGSGVGRVAAVGCCGDKVQRCFER